MKFLLSAALAAAILAGRPCRGDDSVLVPNQHGGYNVVQGGARRGTIPFLGAHGFAAHVAEHAHDKPNFILRNVLRDDGHGNKHLVAQKIYYRTAEDAAAAQALER